MTRREKIDLCRCFFQSHTVISFIISDESWAKHDQRRIFWCEIFFGPGMALVAGLRGMDVVDQEDEDDTVARPRNALPGYGWLRASNPTTAHG